MSRREELRRPFYKRPAPPPLPLSRPYTTLRQPASERLQLQSKGVTIQPLSHYQTRYVSEGLGSLASEVNNAINQARLAQKAEEIAQASETSAQLKKDLEAFRLNEIKNIDQQIEEELVKRGVTKQELQRNSRLRKTVTEWKQKIYRSLNKNLDESEKKIIAGTQESLSSAQQKSREELSKSVTEYEQTVKSSLASQQAQQQQAIEAYNQDIMAQRAQILKDANFTGTWEEFQKDQSTKNYLTGILKNDGVITQSGNELKITKPIEQLSDSQIKALQKVGFDITTQQRDEIKQVMADANWTGTFEEFQKDARTKDYVAGMLISTGTINKTDGMLSLTKPIERLTDNELKMLNKVGFDITKQQRDNAITLTKNVDSLTSSGTIQVSGDNIVLMKPIENITREEIPKLNALGFNITQKDVENAILQISSAPFTSLSSIGQAFREATSSRTGENLTGVTTFTPTQIADQNKIFKEALDNKTITPEEYNKAVSQQNANLMAIQSLASSLVSNGVLKKVEMVGPLQPGQTRPSSYQLNTPLALVSDKDLASLKKVGFDITPEMEDQRIDTKKLISSKTIKVTTDRITLEKPIETLSDTEIERLRNIGIDVPNLSKGPEQYIAEYAAGLPKPELGSKPTFGLNLMPGGKDYARQQLPKFAAVLGDVLRTLAAPIQLVEQLIPGEQWLESGWRGPTSATLKYYQGLTPTEQIAVSGTGFMASVVAGYIEFLPIGFAAKAIPSVAKGLTTKILSVSPTLSSARTSLAIGIKNIATTLKLTGSAAIKALPIESATLQQLTKAMAVLIKNPKFQQAIVWGSMAGINAVQIYSEIASGKPIEDVIERASTSIAGQLGAFKGFQSGIKIATDKFEKMSKLVRLTGGEVKITPKGEIETSFTQMKQVPKTLKELYKLELDQTTGKVKVIGFITKEGGKRSVIPFSDKFTQPIIREYSAEAFNKLMTSGKVGLTNTQLNKLTLKQLFDKVVLNKKLNIYEVKTILAKYLGEDGLRQVELGLLKSGGKELLSMTPKELRTVMYKELGFGSLWTKPLEDLSKGIPIQAGRYEYIGAVIDEAKVKIPPEIQKVFNQLKAMGFDDIESTYWTSQILTKTPEQIAGKMLNLIDNAIDQQKLVDLFKTGIVSPDSTTSQILRSAGLNDKQVQNVIQAVAQSQGDPKTFITTLKSIDPQSSAVTLQMLSKDVFASSIVQIPIKPLTFIVESAAISGSTAMAGAIITSIAPKTAAVIINSISPKSMQAVAPNLSVPVVESVLSEMSPKTTSTIIPYLPTSTLSSALSSILPTMDVKSLSNTFTAMTPEQINVVVPNLSPKDFSSIFPKLTPEALTRLVPNLTPTQFNSMVPKLTPETLNSVFEGLTTDQFTAIMQRVQITPETILQYIQDVPSPVPTGETPTPIPPIIIKSLANFQVRRNKKAMAEQKSELYEVKLLYFTSSEKYKVSSKSFQGAVYESLSRRKTQEIPSRIIVTKIGRQ